MKTKHKIPLCVHDLDSAFLTLALVDRYASRGLLPGT
jgi:hypothetical protein